MGRIINFPGSARIKPALKKVGGKRKRKKPEDFGQLNIFDQENQNRKGRVIQFPKESEFYEEACRLDELRDPSALKYYKLAIEHDDSKADAYCNLGILEYENSNFSGALNNLTQSLTINPRHFEAHYNLANLYSEQGNTQLAKFHYESAINITPEFEGSYFNLGLTLILRNEYSYALEVLEKYRSVIFGKDPEAERLIETLKKSLKSG